MVVLLFLHFFVVRWVTVQSTSMYSTLRPGDLMMVWRYAKWTGMDRNDVVVFRDPLKDNVIKSKRPLLVKRIVGMPGDIVMLRNGELSVNGDPELFPSTGTYSYLVRLKEGHSPVALLKELGLPKEMVQYGRMFIEVPLNAELAEQVMKHPDVANVEPMSNATGSPLHIFPYSPRFDWNSDEYGPLKVPRKGDTIHITLNNLPLYDRMISRYEGHELTSEENLVLIDGEPLERYIVENNYYFVLGDARHNSADSRYWGFVPANHVVGRAGPVIMSNGPN